MSTLKLYHADYSTCSQKVRMTLHEKDLAFESVAMSFAKEEQISEAYLEINPNGVVPTLAHGEEIIIDSSCIVEYLDEVFPDHRLAPDSAVGRAKMRAWMRYMEEVPTVAIRTPSFDQIFLPTLRVIKSEKAFEESRQKRTIRKEFYGKMNAGKGFTEEALKDSLNQLRDTVLRMERALEDSQWVLGDDFSLVDITLAPLIDRADNLGLQFLWSDLPSVTEWLSRIHSRPSFIKTMYKGSRISERLEFKLAVRSARKRNAKMTLNKLQ